MCLFYLFFVEDKRVQLLLTGTHPDGSAHPTKAYPIVKQPRYSTGFRNTQSEQGPRE